MSKPWGDPSRGISSGDVLIRPERHPACRRREAQPGSCTERENLTGDAKGEGASVSNREAESTDAPERGGLLRSSDEAGVMPVERRERVTDVVGRATGNGRNLTCNGRRQPSHDGTSRMMREYQVRICERLGVQFPGPTRQPQRADNVPAWSGQPHKADLSKNSPSMLLSATSEALARLRVSDLTAAAPCGPSLFEHMGFCKQGGPVLDTSQARRVSGSWRMAAGWRRSARSRGSEGLRPSRVPKTV